MSNGDQRSTLHQLNCAAAVERVVAGATHLAPDDACLLIEDAVYHAAQLAELLPRSHLFGLQVDAEEAGASLIDEVQWLDDRQWLQLIDCHSRCVSW